MNRKSGKSSSDESKRRVRRMSEDESVSYKQKREAGREPRPEDEGGRPGRRPEREERPNNLHLYISPRLLDLAAELADEAGMPVRLFLCELIKNGLLAQAGNTGKSRYTAEFVSENKRRISYWRPESGEPSEFEQGRSGQGRFSREEEVEYSDRGRSGHGGQGRAGQGGAGRGRAGQGGAGRGRAGQGGAGRGRAGQGGAGRGRASSGEGGAGRGRASSGEGGAGRGRAGQGGFGKKTGGRFGKPRAGGGYAGGHGKKTGGSGGQGRGGSKPGRKTSR